MNLFTTAATLAAVLFTGALQLIPGDATQVADVLSRAVERVWGDSAAGSVLDVDPLSSWRSEAVALPSVVADGSQLRMYFAGMEASGNPYLSRIRIGLAVSLDGRQFEVANGDQPVLAEGPDGAFDSHSVSHPMVLRVDTGVAGDPAQEWWMYYAGADGTQGANGARTERLGLARSLDGVTWQRETAAIVDLGGPGEIDSTQVASPFVLRTGGLFQMWYGAYDGKHRIAYATSADGRHWTKHGAVNGLRGPDAGELGPSVYFDGREYLIFYNSVDPDAQEWKVYAATSLDGQTWRPANDGRPLVGDAAAGTFAEAGPGRNSAVHLSELVQVGDDLVAYYTGEDRNSVMRIGLLRFTDVTPIVCTYSTSASSFSASAAGAIGTVAITAADGCAWDAAPDHAFISFSNGTGRTGSGSVAFSVAANYATAARTGAATIAGRPFTVNQDGASVDPARQARERTRADFNGDGFTDLLWQDTAGGYLAAWMLRGDHSTWSAVSFPQRILDTDWRMAGAGDFNGDGKPDIVWRHRTSGDLYLWYMDGVTRIRGTPFSFGGEPDTRWKVVGVGDFNGDHKPDLVWQHDTGWLMVYLMDDATLIGSLDLSPARVLDTDWRIVGVGDLNADDRSDVIFQHSVSGELAAWLMNGVVRQQYLPFFPRAIVDRGWRLGAVLDVNSDQAPDLVWHHDTQGGTAVWFMSGTIRMAVETFPRTTQPNWTLASPR